MADITMPQLGETVTEGTITKWFKAVGDSIAEDEVLFEVSTDKVDSEVPSPVSGVVAEIRVPEGETVDVGTVLAVVTDGAAAPAAAPAPTADEAPAPATEEPPAPAAEAAPPAEPDSTPADTPAPAAAPTAPAAAPTAPAAAPTAPAAGAGTKGLLLSPVVRKLINDNNLDAAAITGTGAGGRITRNDVLALLEGGSAAPKKAPAAPAAPAAAPTAAVPTAAAGPAPRAGERDEAIAFTNIRRRTAEHMVRSKATSPHVLTAIEVDFENVDRERRRHKDAFKAAEGASLTYLPFVSRAVVDALRDYPQINATVGDDELIVHHYVNLGYAVDLDFQGLIVPVLHDADTKRLRAIAREVADLAARARDKKLSADDISGGTFTITNPGPYGTLLTAPVINQPQVAILSTDGVKRRPVVVELPDGTESIAIHSVGNLALSFDHRAFDGAYASAFLHQVKVNLETRDWESELA